MGMKDFAGIVKSEKTMKKFADSAVKYLRKHKFDGLDLGKKKRIFFYNNKSYLFFCRF